MQIRATDLIEKYGQPITIFYGTSETESFAFIQPLRMDEQSALYGDYNDSGAEQYLYIGLPTTLLGDNTTDVVVRSYGKDYSVIKAESVILSNEIIYERAVLERK